MFGNDVFGGFWDVVSFEYVVNIIRSCVLFCDFVRSVLEDAEKLLRNVNFVKYC